MEGEYGPVDAEAGENARPRGGSGGVGRVGLAWFMLACVAIAAIFGDIAYHRTNEMQVNGGEHLQSAQLFCLPQDKVAIYQSIEESREGYLNITSVDIRKNGHVVDLSVQTFLPIVLTPDNPVVELRVLLDTRCMPPSKLFSICAEDCPPAETSQHDIFNLSIPDNFFQAGTVPIYSLATPTDPMPAIFEVTGIRGLVDGQLYNGIWGILHIFPETTDVIYITALRFWVTYKSDGPLDWRVPEFCTTGICIDPALGA